jgi:hypothetical protein
MPEARKQDETEKDFISRCMSEIKGEFPDQSQRYAVCKSYSDKSTEKMKKQDLFVLVPRKAENRGKYLSRCSSHSKIKEQFATLKERLGYCLTSFNEYYKYWAKIEEFAEVPADTALGDCIAREKAKGFDYKEAYAHCASKVVAQPGPIVLAEEDKNIDVLGYITKYFYICPGAIATFKHLISMNPNEDTSRMIRNAAVIADSVFKIEDDVIKDEGASLQQLKKARLLVDDFYDLMNVIDEQLGMKHDVDYMENHIEIIKGYVDEEMGDNLLVEPVEFGDLSDACWEGYEPIGLKDRGDGRMVPNCVPIKMTDDDFADTMNDYPEGVKNAAQRALKWAEENGWGSCGTGVGKTRANQLAKGENISVDTIKRMYSYLSRHKVDLESSKEYGDGCGKLMYDSWGGDAALSWSEKKLKQLEK